MANAPNKFSYCREIFKLKWRRKKNTQQQQRTELKLFMFPIFNEWEQDFYLACIYVCICVISVYFDSLFVLYSTILALFFFFCAQPKKNRSSKFLLKVYKASSNYFECWSCDSQMSPKMLEKKKTKRNLNHIKSMPKLICMESVWRWIFAHSFFGRI